MPEFVNVAGAPLALSVRDAVLAVEPRAYHTAKQPLTAVPDRVPNEYHRISVMGGSEPDQMDDWIGTGGTEECAWRDALRTLRGENDG